MAVEKKMWGVEIPIKWRGVCVLKDYYITECKRKGKEKEKNAEISDRIKFLGGFVLVKSRSQGSEMNSFPDISSDRSTLDLKNDF